MILMPCMQLMTNYSCVLKVFSVAVTSLILPTRCRHWDVPDNGNSEFFINLQHNPHLDEAYGGYAVFGYVCENDAASFAVVDAIAAAILGGKKPVISGMRIA